MIASGTACTSPVSDAAAHAEGVGDVGLEERDLALHDADAERGEHGDAEGREPADERGGQRGDHRDRQHGRVQGDDRGEQDRRQRRQRRRRRAKFTSSMRFGDHPALAATRRFSATAEVASPNSVPRVHEPQHAPRRPGRCR